ncbi:MAG: YrhB domain-containing protein [Kiloniellales bacterium]|nr:YrhB domain-containing protein [Kiloniellales bacterium]
MTTIDQDFARKLVATYIGEGRRNNDGFTPVILERETIERDFGWVFFYQSQEFLDSGDERDQMTDNAPVIVDRRDGSTHPTGVAEPIETYIEAYEKSRAG